MTTSVRGPPLSRGPPAAAVPEVRSSWRRSALRRPTSGCQVPRAKVRPPTSWETARVKEARWPLASRATQPVRPMKAPARTFSAMRAPPSQLLFPAERGIYTHNSSKIIHLFFENLLEFLCSAVYSYKELVMIYSIK